LKHQTIVDRKIYVSLNESWQGNFLDARNQMSQVLESALLPKIGRLDIPNLDVVNPVQEKKIVLVECE
jgi:hypothetical protein